MTQNGVVTADGRLTDWISLGVLTSSVPRDAVDDAVEAADRQARRSDGKVPPAGVGSLGMALAPFAADDLWEEAARWSCQMASWGGWGGGWRCATPAGCSPARPGVG